MILVLTLLLLFDWTTPSPHKEPLSLDVEAEFHHSTSQHPHFPETTTEEVLKEKDQNDDCSDVEIVIESSLVENEWIVTFDAFYSLQDRRAILDGILKDTASFDVIKRENPAAEFNSDFDVVKFADLALLEQLNNNPQIKSTRQQRQLTRSLKFVNEQRPDCTPAPDCDEAAAVADSEVKKRDLQAVSSSDLWYGPERHKSRKLMRTASRPVTAELQADILWQAGFKGQGVSVAVFDTGLSENHPHFKNVKDRTNWTNEKTLDDGLGHGTFVAGVIASSAECMGFAPEADLHIYRVFTDKQVSYTSWFLDAFNYAILKKVNVLNLSIGGPDFMDQPFVDKVWELSANNIIMVSAIGNDGPLYGTLNNPADQMDVIGVGGIDSNNKIARFSSRGMTTWELPGGYGRVKPDIVTYGAAVRGSNLKHGCRTLSGTSVASPVVAGVVTLLLSTIEKEKRDMINPAMVKQALMHGARRLEKTNMFEQGAGALDLVSTWKVMQHYSPQASLFPAYIDYNDCPYMWPYCAQPLFYTSLPNIHNVTILNALGVTGRLTEEPIWSPYTEEHGSLLSIQVKYSAELWPWCGYMAVIVSVTEEGATFDGTAAGRLEFTVESINQDGEKVESTLRLEMRIRIAPTPAKEKRVLWDQFHNLRYPPGYFPRDNLKEKEDPLDWNGDHIHTNYRDMFTYLRDAGYFIEVLGQPFTCFDARNYGTLLIVDPEEEYFDEEIEKLKTDVANGLNVLVFGEWYNTTVMEKVRFFDENTRQWWIPDTGGANVPALNELLEPFGIELGDYVGEGEFDMDGHAVYFASGTIIKSFPTTGRVARRTLLDQGAEVLRQEGQERQTRFSDVAVLGITESEDGGVGGRIGVYGDSNCIDSAHMKRDCFWLLQRLLESVNGQSEPIEDMEQWDSQKLHTGNSPMRMVNGHLYKWSRVLQKSLNYAKLPVLSCPVPKWTVPRPSNESFIESKWKHRPLLAIDLDDMDVIEPQAGPVRLNRDVQFSIWAWLCLVMVSFILIIFFYLQFRHPNVVKERAKAKGSKGEAGRNSTKRANRRRRET